MEWLPADLGPVPGVRAGTTLRGGGVSVGSLASLNLAAHVGDSDAAVLENRRRLRIAQALPAEPFWLTQVHGDRVLRHPGQGVPPPEADAAVAFEVGQVLAVLTADCLPVVFAGREGQRIGVAHAGWRGLALGVLERTVEALGGEDLVAWMGPAIGPQAFEVGSEVREVFLRHDPAVADAFVVNARGRWQADLYALARARLRPYGITPTGGAWCTVSDPQRFYSHRRDPGSGRMATLVWRV
jgi:hypothetical protein